MTLKLLLVVGAVLGLVIAFARDLARASTEKKHRWRATVLGAAAVITSAAITIGTHFVDQFRDKTSEQRATEQRLQLEGLREDVRQLSTSSAAAFDALQRSISSVPKGDAKALSEEAKRLRDEISAAEKSLSNDGVTQTELAALQNRIKAAAGRVVKLDEWLRQRNGTRQSAGPSLSPASPELGNVSTQTDNRAESPSPPRSDKPNRESKEAAVPAKSSVAEPSQNLLTVPGVVVNRVCQDSSPVHEKPFSLSQLYKALTDIGAKRAWACIDSERTLNVLSADLIGPTLAVIRVISASSATKSQLVNWEQVPTWFAQQTTVNYLIQVNGNDFGDDPLDYFSALERPVVAGRDIAYDQRANLSVFANVLYQRLAQEARR